MNAYGVITLHALFRIHWGMDAFSSHVRLRSYPFKLYLRRPADLYACFQSQNVVLTLGVCISCCAWIIVSIYLMHLCKARIDSKYSENLCQERRTLSWEYLLFWQSHFHNSFLSFKSVHEAGRVILATILYDGCCENDPTSFKCGRIVVSISSSSCDSVRCAGSIFLETPYRLGETLRYAGLFTFLSRQDQARC